MSFPVQLHTIRELSQYCLAPVSAALEHCRDTEHLFGGLHFTMFITRSRQMPTDTVIEGALQLHMLLHFSVVAQVGRELHSCQT